MELVKNVMEEIPRRMEDYIDKKLEALEGRLNDRIDKAFENRQQYSADQVGAQ